MSYFNVAICSMINVIIEDDVYIGGDCRIYDTDFHSVVFRDRIKGNEDDGVVSKPIVIKRSFYRSFNYNLERSHCWSLFCCGSGDNCY